MINKKIEIKLGGMEIPLWFNNYASAELQKMYGTDITTLMVVLIEKLNDNYLIILSDLIKVGIKGRYLATDSNKPEYFSKVSEMIAEESDDNLIHVWKEVWDVFVEHMGINLPKEENSKKKVKKSTKKTQS